MVFYSQKAKEWRNECISAATPYFCFDKCFYHSLLVNMSACKRD